MTNMIVVNTGSSSNHGKINKGEMFVLTISPYYLIQLIFIRKLHHYINKFLLCLL